MMLWFVCSLLWSIRHYRYYTYGCFVAVDIRGTVVLPYDSWWLLYCGRRYWRYGDTTTSGCYDVTCQSHWWHPSHWYLIWNLYSFIRYDSHLFWPWKVMVFVTISTHLIVVVPIVAMTLFTLLLLVMTLHFSNIRWYHCYITTVPHTGLRDLWRTKKKKLMTSSLWWRWLYVHSATEISVTIAFADTVFAYDTYICWTSTLLHAVCDDLWAYVEYSDLLLLWHGWPTRWPLHNITTGWPYDCLRWLHLSLFIPTVPLTSFTALRHHCWYGTLQYGKFRFICCSDSLTSPNGGIFWLVYLVHYLFVIVCVYYYGDTFNFIHCTFVFICAIWWWHYIWFVDICCITFLWWRALRYSVPCQIPCGVDLPRLCCILCLLHLYSIIYHLPCWMTLFYPRCALGYTFCYVLVICIWWCTLLCIVTPPYPTYIYSITAYGPHYLMYSRISYLAFWRIWHSCFPSYACYTVDVFLFTDWMPSCLMLTLSPVVIFICQPLFDVLCCRTGTLQYCILHTVCRTFYRLYHLPSFGGDNSHCSWIVLKHLLYSPYSVILLHADWLADGAV